MVFVFPLKRSALFKRFAEKSVSYRIFLFILGMKYTC